MVDVFFDWPHLFKISINTSIGHKNTSAYASRSEAYAATCISSPHSPTFTNEDYTCLLPSNGRAQGSIILPFYLICRDTPLVSNYAAQNPQLVAAADSQVVLQYNKNGHITKPRSNSPDKTGPGTVYMLGSPYSQSTNTMLGIHNT